MSRIAFANEMSVICDRLKVNVWELIALANLHPRVNIPQPGVATNPEETKRIRAARLIKLPSQFMSVPACASGRRR